MMADQVVRLDLAAFCGIDMGLRRSDAPVDQIVSPLGGHALRVFYRNFCARFGVNEFHHNGVAGGAIDVLKGRAPLRLHAPDLSPFADGHDDFSEIFSGLCRKIFKSGGVLLIGLPHDQAFIRQTVQAIRQNIGRDTERFYKFIEAAQSEQQIAHNQNTPAIPQNGNRCGNRTAVHFGFFDAGRRFRVFLWRGLGSLRSFRRFSHLPNIATFELQVGDVLPQAFISRHFCLQEGK